MTAALHRLANGLAVVADPVPGATSVAIGVYAGIGARDEAPGEEGLAHLVEHMVFKGTATRSARAIAEAIEDVGGQLNAWTARDQTAFHARVLPGDLDLAGDLIADLLRAPRLEAEDLAREKQVILSEIGECHDTPDDLVHDHLFEAAFGTQRLAHPVLGSAATLTGFDAGACRGWLDRLLDPARLTLVASGAVDPPALLALAEGRFGDLPAHERRAGPNARFVGGHRAEARRAEQAHLALGWAAPAATDPTAPALALFMQAAGGGMSSRLFQALREERGLCYSVYGWTQGFADCGIAGVSLATDRDAGAEALALARDTLAGAADDLDEAELTRARAQLEAGLLMGMESLATRTDSAARMLELHGRLLSVDELLGELRGVTLADARAAGAAMLVGPEALATIGLPAARSAKPARARKAA